LSNESLIVTILTKGGMNMSQEKKCQLKAAACPVCGADINFKKRGKNDCNCKKCDWRCEGHCEE